MKIDLMVEILLAGIMLSIVYTSYSFLELSRVLLPFHWQPH